VAVPALTAYSAAAGQPISGGRWIGGRLAGTLALGGIVASGGMGGYEVRQVNTDGIITPGSQPSAVYRNGALYHGWVDKSGRTGVSKYVPDTGTVTRVPLSSGTQYDAHNNAAVIFNDAGKLVALWSKHTSSEYVRRRVADDADSVASFTAEAGLSNPGGQTSYANPFALSQTAKLYVSTRATSAVQPMVVYSSADGGDTWDAPRTWISNGVQRPYPKFLSDGVSRVHMVFTTGHPATLTTCGLHYAYMQLDGSNVEKFYKLDNTLIGTSGATPATSTTVDSGASGRCWGYDLVVGPDDELWLLYFRFVTSSDHRIMFVKTTGGRASWGTPVQLCESGGTLYAAEAYSHAGAVFNREDPRQVYLCRREDVYHEVERWDTSDLGATWGFAKAITSGSTAENWQIVSPENHGGAVPAMWCHGIYTNWNAGYDCEQLALVRGLT
jgi:hypothetical protein